MITPLTPSTSLEHATILTRPAEQALEEVAELWPEPPLALPPVSNSSSSPPRGCTYDDRSPRRRRHRGTARHTATLSMLDQYERTREPEPFVSAPTDGHLQVPAIGDERWLRVGRSALP